MNRDEACEHKITKNGLLAMASSITCFWYLLSSIYDEHGLMIRSGRSASRLDQLVG